MTQKYLNCTLPAIDSADHVLVIRMPLFSKARPRLTRTGHAFMPPAYKLAQAEMRKLIREQWEYGPLEGPVSLKLIVRGEGRGDTDNIAGAFMDAAQGILWIDDRVSVIPKLSIEWQKAAKANSEWVVIIHHVSV
jgi:Holliday junction resolvase RusA-like endonuclease